MATDRAKMATQFMKVLPFSSALGMELVSIDGTAAEISMPYDPAIVGDPDTGIVHGGAVSALLDTVCGIAVFLQPDSDVPTATIDLRIDYMRPAEPGKTIHARAEVYHTTRSVAFLRAQAWTDDRNRLVATGTGAFTFSKTSASDSTS
ncbi:thioesterase [Rhodobacteraceae bacterium (ex Bugula neritina AB1)]|nr:thioesterase [Rhodobacteraceae bacterium (ex Bugula neritina AB1)]